MDDALKIVGDLNTDAVFGVVDWITPVPGRVGPVTVVIFMRNSIVYRQRHFLAWRLYN